MAFLLIIKVSGSDLFYQSLVDDVNGQRLFFSIASTFLLLPLRSFLLLAVFLNRLRRVVMWRGQYLILEFRFFEARFVLGALSLHLWRSVIRWVVAFGATGIKVLNYGARSQVCFDFHVHCSFHHLFKTSWRLILLLNLDFDRGFEAFLKIADCSWLGRGPNSANFNPKQLEILKVRVVILSFF